MPKLSHRPPKYSKLKKYAVVYLNGKIHYLGRYGSEESKVAYARLVAESRVNPTMLLPKAASAETAITVSDLVAAFLTQAEATLAQQNYDHYRIVVRDFLLALYSQEEYAEDFRKAMHLLTKDVAEPDFKVALNCYYLEHDPDLEVEHSREELAA